MAKPKPEPWVPATLNVRTPDDVVLELAEKAEPVLRPVMVYGGATLSLAGNAGGVAVGYALLVDPDPTASKVGGAYILVVSLDGMQANVRTLLKGEPVPTALNQGVKAGLIRLGQTETQAEHGAAAVELYSNTFQAGKMAMMLPVGAPRAVSSGLTIEPVERIGAGTVGRDFVRNAENGLPRFEARLLDGETSLRVGYTDNIPRTPIRIREVQQLAGGPGSITRIEGLASAEFEAEIRAGTFDLGKAAAMLGRTLGGTWNIKLVARPGQAGVFDVVAELTGSWLWATWALVYGGHSNYHPWSARPKRLRPKLPFSN
jgi:hypothetical protein